MEKVDIHNLLNVNPDLTKYGIKYGDKKRKVVVSVESWKMTLLAINVCSRRIHDLVIDLEKAEAKIDTLERLLGISDDLEDTLERAEAKINRLERLVCTSDD